VQVVEVGETIGVAEGADSMRKSASFDITLDELTRCTEADIVMKKLTQSF
jgi:hypothetical protein